MDIRQKLFNKKYCNVGMIQQWPLAKKDKKSDVEMVTGQQRKGIRNGHWLTKKSDVGMERPRQEIKKE